MSLFFHLIFVFIKIVNLVCFSTGEQWSPEASEVLFSLTSGIVLQAQIAGYSEDGFPEIYLYACFAKDVSIQS